MLFVCVRIQFKIWHADAVVFTAGFFEMKMKYDESDNALIRASRAVTDKMTDLIGERLIW